MAQTSEASLFSLPERREVVVVRVRLSDGSVVERTPEEILPVPGELTVALEDLHVKGETR